MDLLEAIHTRRSIRKYEPGEISEKDLKIMLSAAMTAPSAGNARPWEFIVVTDREILDRVPEYSRYAPMARQAPLGVLVCGNLSREKYEGYWVQDCSAAMQNLLLVAHGLGYGAVWTGIHPMADRIAPFKEHFGLPEGVEPLGLALIGRPAQSARYENRYDPEQVHQNRWGGSRRSG